MIQAIDHGTSQLPDNLTRSCPDADVTLPAAFAYLSMDTMSSQSENNLQAALKACKSSFLSVGFFSFFVNTLMLVPTLYMIQVSGRVVPSGSTSTLLMLTLILTVLLLTLGSLEWVRSRIMVRISNRLDVLLSRDVYRASFKRSLQSGGGRCYGAGVE